ncbi:glycosyltransferase family 39 protein [bacterium]|nr:glycosyltransferase family 39 protein [bacterium]
MNTPHGKNGVITDDLEFSRRPAEGLPAFTDRIIHFLETKTAFVLIVLSGLYLLIVSSLSFRKVFWNDELFTLYFAKLPVWTDLWWSLSTGADQIPPTFVMITKFCLLLFGTNEISVRLPEMIGFLVMSLSLYRIVSHRTSSIHGLIAMLFPMITSALYFSYEARPYGLLLGCSAMAFLCWQRAVEGNNRKLFVFGLCGSLAAALMSHYYGILLFFPIILGELVRTFFMRKFDHRVWIAIFMALTPLLLFLPLMNASIEYAPHFWSKPVWSQIFHFYDSLFRPAALTFALVCILTALLLRFRFTEWSGPGRSFVSHELAAGVGFVLLPVVGVLIGKVIVGAFSERYAITAVIGFSVLVPFAIYYFSISRRIVALWLVCIFIGFLARSVIDFTTVTEDSKNVKSSFDFVEKNTEKDIPVVSWWSPLRFWYYAPKDLAERVYYLADVKASVGYLGNDTIDRGLLDLRPWFPIPNVRAYDLFLQSNPQFYLYYSSSDEDWRWNWILSGLLADKRKIEIKARDGNQILFLVNKE